MSNPWELCYGQNIIKLCISYNSVKNFLSLYMMLLSWREDQYFIVLHYWAQGKPEPRYFSSSEIDEYADSC